MKDRLASREEVEKRLLEMRTLHPSAVKEIQALEDRLEHWRERRKAAAAALPAQEEIPGTPPKDKKRRGG